MNHNGSQGRGSGTEGQGIQAQNQEGTEASLSLSLQGGLPFPWDFLEATPVRDQDQGKKVALKCELLILHLSLPASSSRR